MVQVPARSLQLKTICFIIITPRTPDSAKPPEKKPRKYALYSQKLRTNAYQVEPHVTGVVSSQECVDHRCQARLSPLRFTTKMPERVHIEYTGKDVLLHKTHILALHRHSSTTRSIGEGPPRSILRARQSQTELVRNDHKIRRIPGTPAYEQS